MRSFTFRAPPPAAPLARYVLLAYLLLIVYASLHPLTGWRDLGLSPFSFLEGGWPRVMVPFDAGANLAAYLPLGLLIVASLPRRWPGLLTVALAAALGASLSLTLEALQTYLPSRVPSLADFALNSAGAAIGALGYALARRRVAMNAYSLRDLWFLPGKPTDAGLVVIGLWLLTQLNPETLLFGTGDLRDLFQAVPAQVVPPVHFVRAEALVAGCNLAAVSLIAGALVAPKRPAWLVVGLLVLAAAAIRSVAFGVLVNPNEMFAWATPGAELGVAAGLGLALAAGWLPRGARIAIAGVLLMAATAIVNFAPGNPYLANSLSVWRQGHFFNFNGLTGFVSMLWPFVALGWLISGRPARAPYTR